MPSDKDDLMRAITRYSSRASLSSTGMGPSTVPYLDERGVEREMRLQEDVYLEALWLEGKRKLATYTDHAIGDLRRTTMAIRAEAAVFDEQILERIPEQYSRAREKIMSYQDHFDGYAFEPYLTSAFETGARSMINVIDHLPYAPRIEPEEPDAWVQGLVKKYFWNNKKA